MPEEKDLELVDGEPKHTTIPEIEDVVRILTDIAQETWEEYRDDDNLTVGEIIGVITKKIPDVIISVKISDLKEEMKNFKLKDQKAFAQFSMFNLVWMGIFGPDIVQE